MLPELLVGFSAGIVSAMTGIGGAVIAIPLLLALGNEAHTAVGTAILLVTVAAANGAYSYSKRGLVDWHSAMRVGIPGILASVVGAWISTETPPSILVYAIAFVVAFFGVLLFFSKHTAGGRNRLGKRNAAVLGAFVGFTSGLTGIGGGTILASSYAAVFGFAVHSAVATTHATILVFALPAAAAHVALGSADLVAALPLLFGGLLGSKAGVRLAVKMPAARLKKGMAVLFVAIGAWLALSQYLKAG